ncbi:MULTISPECIES: hypothetical protein [Terrabacteria group]|uniref:Ppx/GppA phosphatase family protein n=1 Tax=Bacillati TaxID=1783272 RepID=UPI001C6DE18D|nr:MULTISPECIES: hypothetical protein [Terrabacteria group]MBW9212045.1 hypothetical protein [Trueperella sp. zg.1013]
MLPIAIIDLGSNTIVLEVYNEKKEILYHESIPAHLIQYVDAERFMSQQGLSVAHDAMAYYDKYIRGHKIKNVHIVITEPARIQNQSALLAELLSFHYPIHALKGDEEAYYDSLAIENNHPNLKEWFAFDIGGGSTELIHQADKEKELYSVPLGCVRLARGNQSISQLVDILKKTTNQKPNLFFHKVPVLGIGGTIRAIAKVLKPNTISPLLKAMDMEKLYQDILKNDLETRTLIQQYVPESRQPLILPGLKMILALIHHFHIQEIQVSQEGVRQGFLYHLLEQ